MYAYRSAPSLTNITFEANSATVGGGMANDYSNSILNNVIFRNNSAANGGGMSNWNHSNVTLTDVLFEANLGEGAGGMTIINSDPVLNRVTFYANRGGQGGGMAIRDSSPSLTNVSFIANSGWEGGAMNNVDSTPSLVNVVFIANYSSGEGGGIFNSEESSTSLTNVTFSANDATGLGKSIFNTWGSHMSIRNSIIQGDRPTQPPSDISNDDDRKSTITIEHSILQDECRSSWICNDVQEKTTPLFIHPPNADDGDWMTLDDNDYGDLRLQVHSPAIDAGDNTGISPDVAVDLNGYPRIGGGQIDIGAHEAYSFRVSKSVAPTWGFPGEAITYALHFKNFQDENTIHSPRITDYMHDFISVQSIESAGAVITQTAVNPYQWEIEDLQPGASGIITITGIINENATNPTNITNTVTISSVSGDADIWTITAPKRIFTLPRFSMWMLANRTERTTEHPGQMPSPAYRPLWMSHRKVTRYG